MCGQGRLGGCCRAPYGPGPNVPAPPWWRLMGFRPPPSGPEERGCRSPGTAPLRDGEATSSKRDHYVRCSHQERPSASATTISCARRDGRGDGDGLWVRRQARKAERDNPPLGRFITVDGVRLH